MNFFAQQDLARRNSRLLIVLFSAAVLLLVTLTNAAIAAFLFFSEDYNVYSGSRGGMAGLLSYFSWARFGTIGLVITITIALVVLVKWLQLSTGGKVVAESMGGIRLMPQSLDAAERRCLNVVEEIALAANMPVPSVYVLNDERGINAFAAGFTPADAVVAVTRGAIVHLKRHEMQGVIAHEFSHILNGDMRLNIRLAALLKGITFIGDSGQFLLRNSDAALSTQNDRNGNAAALPLLGLALWLVGLMGGLAAGSIKAAISRQKEYLADASAVQFTRSADGIGDALKVIGGYIPGTLVHAARAPEMSHIFFAQIQHRLWEFFATHPPLRERISRVDPQWDGQYIKRKTIHYPEQPSAPGSGAAGVGRAALVAAAMGATLAETTAADQVQTRNADFAPAPDQLEQETAARQDIPLVLVEHSREPLGAHALVYTLLLGADAALRQSQLAIISAAGITGLDTLVNTLYPAVHALGAPRRLPLLELCLPALKSMSEQQYRRCKHTLVQLIQADKCTQLHEWCLYQLVRHYLDPAFTRVKPSRPRYRALHQLAVPLCTVLSVLAHAGSGAAQEAFRLGADALELHDAALLPLAQCDVSTFSRAVYTLANAYPLLKPRVLKAMALAAGADGTLSPQEWEILASVAAVMDCPMPTPLAP